MKEKKAWKRISKLDVLSEILLIELNLHETVIAKNYSVKSNIVQLSLNEYHIDFILDDSYTHVHNCIVKSKADGNVDNWYEIYRSGSKSFNELLNDKKLHQIISSHECTCTYF